jgi:hypothetical protein
MPNKEPASPTQKAGDGDVQAQVHQAAEQLRSSAVMRVGSARDAADSARARAAERVRKLGGAVRKIGEHMRIEEQHFIADRANVAGKSLDTVADYIAQRDLADVIHDAGDIARKQPALVLGGTFLLGLAAGRLLKEGAGALESSTGELKTGEPRVREARASESRTSERRPTERRPTERNDGEAQKSRSATQVRQ